jgi:branched-chain amino acid transport system ATP-binding protein
MLIESPILSVRDLDAGYNGVPFLHDIGFDLLHGEVLAAVGSNGAGKTTLLRALSGLLVPFAGSIVLGGADIAGKSPAEIVRRGMAHVPERQHIFPGLTVFENLRIGAYLIKDKQQIESSLATVFELFPVLKERRNQIGTTLSGGEQQMLATGRAMMSSPKLLLLDEPSMGLAPIMIERLFDSLQKLRGLGLSIVLVEQNAALALELASRVIVLNQGRLATSGKLNTADLSEEIIAAYLG